MIRTTPVSAGAVPNAAVRRRPAGAGAVLLAGVLLAGTLAGCRPGPDPNTAALAGRVLIDGEPVRKGSVQFMPVERGRPTYAEVRDGAYAARAPKGRVRAIFSSVKETGRMVQVYSTQVPEVLDILPESLRDGIEITVDSDDPSRDFVLSSGTAQP